MRISYNWLKEFIDFDVSVEELGDLLTSVGLEVEKIEKFQSIEGGLENIVIGEVKSCEKHPNADKLSVTSVNVGEDETKQIICGASNVKTGQKVVVAKVGSTLYPKNGAPFKIKKAKLRGETSEGMICAEDEIGLGNNHDGILELNTDLPNGTPAADYFEICNDSIYEIGLTPNRGDAASHLGVARDIKAIFNNSIKIPDSEEFVVDNQELKIDVEVRNPEGCPRYAGLTIADIEVKESPKWLKNKLLGIGLNPINNIVDITNYILFAYGQPLHAFDANKISDNKVIVDTCNKGTKFTTLDEKEHELESYDLMICNTEGPMCMAGIFGGLNSGVTRDTKSIFLESAYFSPDYIRKSSIKHSLKTDSSFRFERGTDPEGCVKYLKIAALLIKNIAGGKITSDVVDIITNPIKPQEFSVSYKNINRLIGKSIPKDFVFNTLKNLDIEIDDVDDKGFKVRVPKYRTDVTREADLIEDILRFYGFNNVETSNTLGSDYIAPVNQVDNTLYQQKISDLLYGRGFHEVMTNSLTKASYYLNHSEFTEDHNVEIINRLSDDLGIMRKSMIYSGLEVIDYNIKRRYKNLKLFEFGRVYSLEEQYKEHNILSIFLTGLQNDESWRAKNINADFYDLALITHQIFDTMNVQKMNSTELDEEKFDYGLQFEGNGLLAKLGKLSASLKNQLGIEQDVFYSEVYWDTVLKNIEHDLTFQDIIKFPEVRRDLSLVLDNSITFKDINEISLRVEKKLIKSINVFSIYEGENLGESKKSYAISFILQDEMQTLTDKVIDKTMNKLIAAFENEISAIIRK